MGALKRWPFGHFSVVPVPARVVRSVPHSEHATVRSVDAIVSDRRIDGEGPVATAGGKTP